MEHQKIDVIVLTRNSARLLRECLESVFVNVPVNRLFVIDNNSTDGTLTILDDMKKKHANIVTIQDRGNRATARNLGIKQVETDWFLFVDSDAVLCKDWFLKAVPYMKNDVGAIWGVEVWSTIRDPKMLKMFLWITRKIFEIRGGTHDTLVRSEAVRDLRIPENLHVFEDAYIMKYVSKRGFKVVACYVPFCFHFRPQNVWSFRGSSELVSDAFKFGSPLLVAKLIFPYGFYAAYSVYKILRRSN